MFMKQYDHHRRQKHCTSAQGVIKLGPTATQTGTQGPQVHLGFLLSLPILLRVKVMAGLLLHVASEGQL